MSDMVIGPCPGCHNWTLQAPQHEHPDTIEAILQEHANHCRTGNHWWDTANVHTALWGRKIARALRAH